MNLKEAIKESDFYKFFQTCSIFEKTLLIVLQIIGCILPFTLILLFTGKEYWLWFNVILWSSGILLGLLLKLSKWLRTGENLQISFMPRINKMR